MQKRASLLQSLSARTRALLSDMSDALGGGGMPAKLFYTGPSLGSPARGVRQEVPHRRAGTTDLRGQHHHRRSRACGLGGHQRRRGQACGTPSSPCWNWARSARVPRCAGSSAGSPCGPPSPWSTPVVSWPGPGDSSATKRWTSIFSNPPGMAAPPSRSGSRWPAPGQVASAEITGNTASCTKPASVPGLLVTAPDQRTSTRLGPYGTVCVNSLGIGPVHPGNSAGLTL